MKRAILIVMDSLGVGESPDAGKYGDEGADTLLHASEGVKGFCMPELSKLGMGNIVSDKEPGIVAEGRYSLPVNEVTGSFCRMRELSAGKDTITGHWEIAGIETKTPFKTYPDGFPDDFIKEFEKAIGRECIGNYPASGTVIIDDLGDEHESTGKPIVYTSADSVFQIAANTDVIPLEELYEICGKARALLQGKWACGRVIARPYIKTAEGKRVRTSDRHDYAVSPHSKTLLDNIKASGKTVHAIGKINDIFNGSGVTESVHTSGNMDGVDKTIEALKTVPDGLIFTNLVDFDSLYGHRRDPEGYGRAIMEFDDRLPEILAEMKEEDILFITADHGNDPIHAGFDHTREYVPVVMTGAPGKGMLKAGVDLGTRTSFGDLGQTIAEYLGVKPVTVGKSFLKDVLQGVE